MEQAYIESNVENRGSGCLIEVKRRLEIRSTEGVLWLSRNRRYNGHCRIRQLRRSPATAFQAILSGINVQASTKWIEVKRLRD